MPDSLLILALLIAVSGVIIQQYRLALVSLDRDHHAQIDICLLRGAAAARHEVDQTRAEMADLRRTIKGAQQ